MFLLVSNAIFSLLDRIYQSHSLLRYNSIPTFNVCGPDDLKGSDGLSKKHLFIVRPPTCCGGCCINCCAEEKNPCAKKPEERCCDKGCCKVSFRFYKPSESGEEIDFKKAKYKGRIISKQKSLATHVFTDANAFDVKFDDESLTAAEKGIFIGTAIFLNTIFFEGQDQ